MKQIKFFFFLMVLFFSPLLWAESDRVDVSVELKNPHLLHLALQDCLRLASRHHQKLKAKDYEIDAARWRLVEAEARFWPVIDYKYRAAPVPQDASNAAEAFFTGDITFFNSIRVAGGMPLYAFEQLTVAQKLAHQGILAAEVRREKEEGEIHFEVKQLYYAIQVANDLALIANDALEKIKNKLREEEETKEHSPYEISKLKIYKLDIAKRLSEAIQKEKVAREALRVQLGLEPDQPFALAKEYIAAMASELRPLAFYLERAAADRPDSHLIAIGVEAKRLEYVLEKKKNFPQIGFGGFIEFGRTTNRIRNVGTTDDFNNPFNFTRAGLGLEMQGKLDFHGSGARINRLNSEYFKASLEGDLAKRGIALEVENVYREALRAQENLYRAEEKRKLARQMLFFSKTNIEVGVGEEKEYTDALQLVLESRAEYLKAVFDFNVALAKLDWKVGKS